MFSQFDNEEMEDYISRLNAQLKKMPPEDRAELHQELHQHLEALVVAHEKLGATREEAFLASLKQFGDPRKFGRRMFREWQRAQSSAFNPILATFLCMSGLLSLGWLWCISYGSNDAGLMFLEVGLPLAAGTATGFLLPRPRLRGIVFAVLFILTLIGCAYIFFDRAQLSNLVVFIGELAGYWLTLGTSTVWIASRLRRSRVFRARRQWLFQEWRRQMALPGERQVLPAIITVLIIHFLFLYLLMGLGDNPLPMVVVPPLVAGIVAVRRFPMGGIKGVFLGHLFVPLMIIVTLLYMSTKGSALYGLGLMALLAGAIWMALGCSAAFVTGLLRHKRGTHLAQFLRRARH